MTDQMRLPMKLAPESLVIQAQWVNGEGWRATVNLRRATETWADCEAVVYSCLHTDELVDVLEAELQRRLLGAG